MFKSGRDRVVCPCHSLSGDVNDTVKFDYSIQMIAATWSTVHALEWLLLITSSALAVVSVVTFIDGERRRRPRHHIARLYPEAKGPLHLLRRGSHSATCYPTAASAKFAPVVGSPLGKLVAQREPAFLHPLYCFRTPRLKRHRHSALHAAMQVDSSGSSEQRLAAIQTDINECLWEEQQGLARKVRLVAVSKTRPPEDVMALYTAGQRHFGENYVQELASKAAELPQDIRWHFIGKLQRNKVRIIAKIPNLWAVEGVDSIKLATALENGVASLRSAADAGALRVFVQVNTSGEESKSGCDPADCVNVVGHILKECPNLKLQGLMTIGEYGGDGTKDFIKLRECRDVICSAHGLSVDDVELSMGMSADYLNAIQLGSTSGELDSTIVD